MKVNVSKELLQESLSLASRFTSTKLSSLTTLQGILLKGEKGKIHLYSTDLISYFHTTMNGEIEKDFEIIIDPKKIIEFLQLLNSGKIEIELKEKQITIIQGKTRGNFPLIVSDEFPLPPEIKEKKQTLDLSFFKKNIPLVLFSTSSDETRPALTGINFVVREEDLTMVATDGFRLSIIKTKKELEIPSILVPGEFLAEVLRFVKDEKEISFYYSNEEKMVGVIVGKNEFYSRLIEGEFPPYERVIPPEIKTSVTVEKEEFLRSIKLISIFARDFSNVVVCEFKKDGLYVRPKKDNTEENSTYLEAEVKGEEQKVAFNYKFILDFINNISGGTIKIEILRADAPVVFKSGQNENFIHIIMPVRIQE